MADFKTGERVILVQGDDLHDRLARTGDLCVVVGSEGRDGFVNLERMSDGYAFGCYSYRLEYYVAVKPTLGHCVELVELTGDLEMFNKHIAELEEHLAARKNTLKDCLTRIEELNTILGIK